MSAGTTINIPKLEISAQERVENKLTSESLDAAVRLLRETGLVLSQAINDGFKKFGNRSSLLP